MSDRYRFILGALILGGLMVLAVFVALGRVEEKTSYGLVPIVTILAKVALDFSDWAFRGDRESRPPDQRKHE